MCRVNGSRPGLGSMAWGSAGLGERLKNRFFRSSTLGIRVACGVSGEGFGAWWFSFLGGGGVRVWGFQFAV